MAAAAVLPPPSPFAAMLRQSKFASFDPQIAQVYTAHPANAHRGNWGLKRPLAVRTRGKHITVRAVDSREQQTEWARGDQASLWLQRWAELGTEPSLRGGEWDRILGPVKRNLWLVDSEFSRGTADARMLMPPATVREEKAPDGEEKKATQEEEEKRLQAETAAEEKRKRAVVANILAMKPREYRRYVEKLRAQRPGFEAFLKGEVKKSREREKRGKSQLPVAGTLYDQAVLRSMDLQQCAFLQDRALSAYLSPTSRVIEQQPHRTAGLSYALESPLTSFFLTKPQPGRYLTPLPMTRRPVSFAGMVTHLSRGLGDNSNAEGTTFLAVGSKLTRGPTAVAAFPMGLSHVRVDASVREVSTLNMLRQNPHRPGSLAYVEHGVGVHPVRGKRDGVTMTKRSTLRKKNTATPAPRASSEHMVTFLRDVINKTRPGL